FFRMAAVARWLRQMGRSADTRRLGSHRTLSQRQRRTLPKPRLADRTARRESRHLPSRPDYDPFAAARPRAGPDGPDPVLPPPLSGSCFEGLTLLSGAC